MQVASIDRHRRFSLKARRFEANSDIPLKNLRNLEQCMRHLGIQWLTAHKTIAADVLKHTYVDISAVEKF